MESVERCELCGGKDFAVKIKGTGTLLYGERVVECRGCGLHFLNPRLDAEGLRRFYALTYPGLPSNRPGETLMQEKAAARFEVLSPHIERGTRVLEIGCGSGFLLRRLKGIGCEVSGTEVCPERIAKARANGVTVLETEDLPEGEFDLVLAIHVLEHLREPRRFLREAHRLARRIYVEVPALDLVSAHPEYHISAHLFDFDREHLRRLMAEEGWKKAEEIRYQDYPKWYGILGVENVERIR